MDSKSRFLLGSLMGLILLSTALYFLSKEKARPDIDKTLFQLNTDKIDHVTFQSSNEKIELTFENNQWRVNKKWIADASMIKVLFATLKQVEVKRPLPTSMKDSVASLLESNGVKVTMSGEDQSEFFVDGNAAKTETWFMKALDRIPYTVVIPGYRVYVGGIFELDESGWRNKRIFEFNWRNFKSLAFTNSSDAKQNFEIEPKDGFFGVKGLATSDTTKVNDYLDAVSLLFASRFVKPGSSVDSLSATRPALRIEIKDIASRSFSLEIFYPRRKDDEIYGRLGDGQLVAISRNEIAGVVRTRDYFQPVAGK